jgi:hypothetical protein
MTFPNRRDGPLERKVVLTIEPTLDEDSRYSGYVMKRLFKVVRELPIESMRFIDGAPVMRHFGVLNSANP